MGNIVTSYDKTCRNPRELANQIIALTEPFHAILVVVVEGIVSTECLKEYGEPLWVSKDLEAGLLLPIKPVEG